MSLRNPLPHAAQHAKALRRESTSAEAVLWECLRNRKFHGLKFRRQAPVGRFIVDFLCAKPPLIIELDGPIHNFQVQEDKQRLEVIQSDYNIPIVRFTNEDVCKNLPEILARIEEILLPRLIP